MNTRLPSGWTQSSWRLYETNRAFVRLRKRSPTSNRERKNPVVYRFRRATTSRFSESAIVRCRGQFASVAKVSMIRSFEETMLARASADKIALETGEVFKRGAAYEKWAEKWPRVDPRETEPSRNDGKKQEAVGEIRKGERIVVQTPTPRVLIFLGRSVDYWNITRSISYLFIYRSSPKWWTHLFKRFVSLPYTIFNPFRELLIT